MDMFAQDEIWQIVAVVLAVITITVMIVIFILQRKKKKLTFQILSDYKLLGVKEELRGKVKILYDGNEVENVQLLTLKFSNSGNEAISSSDFESPIIIAFKEPVEILSCEIIDENPEDLGTQLEIDGFLVSISPILLNSRDSFTLKILISDYQDLIDISGRIKGVNAITPYRESRFLSVLPPLVGITAGTFISYITIDALATNPTSPKSWFVYSIVVLLLIFLYWFQNKESNS